MATKTVAGPTHLTMGLYHEGMTALHRAGLGGLACTLKVIEQDYKSGHLGNDEVPGGPWDNGAPWDIGSREVTLCFGQAEAASEFLKRLFAYAFPDPADSHGLIHFPGQYGGSPPNAAVLADLQAGLTLTFLQHGRVRELAKNSTVAQHDPDGTGVPGVSVEYRACTRYKHQSGWEDLIDRKGRLLTTPLKVEGPLNPGAVVRHNAFPNDTKVEDIPARLLPLYFAIVGCLALPVNRGVAALIVPEIEDLITFLAQRPLMTPTAPCDCVIANAADGALQAQVRLRGRKDVAQLGIPGCSAMTFMPTAWASQQKSRVATVQVPAGDDLLLNRFEIALQLLPTRIVGRAVREATGRGKQKQVTERQESFRIHSNVRPLVAENLALGRPWYASFTRLFFVFDAGGNRVRDRLHFEREGLNAMIKSNEMWTDEAAPRLVQAVHEAIRRNLGRIRDETDGKGREETDAKSRPLSQATKNRWDKFRERLRISLAGAKTREQVRFALCDLFSRGGQNAVLGAGWPLVLPFLLRDWQLVRDLGLLALTSYVSRDAADDKSDNSGSKSKS
jgi:CRISPR-associated protein Cas8a1/Csx13